MNRNETNRKAGKAEGVTTTFGNKILGALGDLADAVERGEVTERFTCRQVKLNLKPRPYPPERVKETRRLLRISQTLFARFLGTSPKTVRSWEQGINPPNPMACRFMDEIQHRPEYWSKRLRELLVRCDSSAREQSL